MADVLALRKAMRDAAAALALAQAVLDQLEAEVKQFPFESNPWRQIVARIQAQIPIVQNLTQQSNNAQAAYQAAVLADPMHAADAGLPLVLLPVRIETAYLPGAAGTDLVVRVYPDDIHVDTHEPELTSAELAAGTAYWQAVWGAGTNQDRLDAAWSAVLNQLKPLRAAWTVEALRPSVPRPSDETPAGDPQPDPPLPDVPTRPSTFTRPARTDLLPDHWHVIGIRNGQELFNVDGAPIPDSLDVSFGPPGTGAPASDLPFDANSRWLVDLDAAIANGMAVRIPLAGPDLTVDQLFVLGVSASVAPDVASARLQSALTAHQNTNGLAFLPPGTPTNNTPATRSAWESAPQPPTPSQVETARAAFVAGSNQNAAVAANALGIDGSEVLSIAPDGLTDQQSAGAIMLRLLYSALGGKALELLYTTWDVPAGSPPTMGGWKPHIDFTQTPAIAEHTLGWVCSRGTLPIMRVGNQPYGLLPALSLADWALPANDPTTQLVSWLRVFQRYWLAGVAAAPRVKIAADPSPDATVVNVFSRLPVSTDIMIRTDGDPANQAVGSQPLPPAPIPGLPMNSELFYSVPGATAQQFPVKAVVDPVGDQGVLLMFQGLFTDGIAVMEQNMTQTDFLTKHKALFGSKTFPGAPPPDLLTTLIQDAFTDPIAATQVNSRNNLAGFIICAAMFYDPANAQLMQSIAQNLPDAKTFLAQWTELCAVDPAVYESTLREILDIFSHRLDAWITSLAARRLDEMRAAKPSGAVIGAYGWVEDLAPRTDLTAVNPPPAGFDSAFSSPRQKYIHAPSLQHAATAAVLRAGYDSHPDPNAFAVNLVSSRVRVADRLAEGVRNGQTLGALLGYQFERGLHDAGQDVLIAPLRQQFPLPLPSGPDADANGAVAKEVIAARNVVDGLSLYNNRDTVRAQFAAQAAVGTLLDDLVNSVDSLGDLLLAESVHHLVGGNPLRAGLAADTIGRGEPVPDRFDVVRTPRSGTPLTWHLGALLPADWRSSSIGWNKSRPRAQIEPHLDAWVASMLGNAAGWTIQCTVTSPAGDQTTQTIGLDTLNISALDVVVEAAGDPSLLELRIVESLEADGAASVSQAPATDGTVGFAELLSFAERIRTLLGKSSPLQPQHVQGADSSPVFGFDVAELDNRLASLEASFLAAVQALQDATASSDLQAMRSALIGLADHGIAGAWPIASSDPAVIGTQASAVLGVVQPLTDPHPPAPSGDAQPADLTTWLDAATQYARSILGSAFPITPVFSLPSDSAYATSVTQGAAPNGSDTPDVMVWLRRIARIRNGAEALHDTLLAAETLLSAPIKTTVTQLPLTPGVQWAGVPFLGAPPSRARLSTVLSTPSLADSPIDPNGAFCGIVCDSWTEHLPGLTSVASGPRQYESAEVTGMAFTVEAPDAYAPQSLLLAIAPDPTQGWSLDVLLDTVQETLQLAKIRTIDLGDLPRLGRVLPVIHSQYNVDQMITDAGVHA